MFFTLMKLIDLFEKSPSVAPGGLVTKNIATGKKCDFPKDTTPVMQFFY